MPLLAVQVENLRCLRLADLQLDAKLTLITGPNAAGKTSLLEAVFFLGRGRSFRTRQIERLISTGADALTLIGQLASVVRPVVLGIRASRDGTEARIGGRPVETLADLATAFPVQVIDPNVHKLIEEGPSGRRRAMDWGVFHVEHGFAGDWQRYQRALRQRNAALRTHLSAPATRAWDAELTASGAALSSARQRYVHQLQPIVERTARALVGLDVRITLSQGWPSNEALDEALAASWARDARFRATTAGPHRADLEIRADGFLARDRVSRGQQKLLAAALILAQLELLQALSSRAGTLLLDDPAAELDADHLQALMTEVTRLGPQLIVTATARPIAGMQSPGAKFHVEQGIVRQML